jgi:hypothetical protein
LLERNIVVEMSEPATDWKPRVIATGQGLPARHHVLICLASLDHDMRRDQVTGKLIAGARLITKVLAAQAGDEKFFDPDFLKPRHDVKRKAIGGLVGIVCVSNLSHD